MADDRTPAAPVEGSVYYHPEGAALLARIEDGQAVLVLTRDRVVFTRRIDPAELGSKYEPEFVPAMHDADRGRLVAERDALAATLREVETEVFAAAEQLGHRERTALAADVRGRLVALYRQRIEEAT